MEYIRWSDRPIPRDVAYDLEFTFRVHGMGINMAANFDASPTQMLPIYREEFPGALAPARWGLIPFWFKGKPGDLKATHNATAERIDTAPSYREAFKQRRCLVPMNGFYEWQEQPDGSKIRHYVKLADRRMFTCAGIWDEWQAPDGTKVRSFAIVTCPANELMAKVYHRKSKEPRMPVILDSDGEVEWLDRDIYDDLDQKTRWKAVLKPFPADAMVAYPVKSRAAKPEDLIVPIGPVVKP